MAKIVLGIGTSHGPMLSTPPEEWGQRVEADRQNPEHPFRGRTYRFEQLVEMRKSENLAEQIMPSLWRERHAQCRRAISQLADVFAKAKVDAAVIVGNDQHECFVEANMPAFGVYRGPTISNVPPTPAQIAEMPPGVPIAIPGHCPPEAVTYPCLAELGTHLIERLMEEEFDVAQLAELPHPLPRFSGIPHAYGFVYRQIMRDDPPPSVPVVINTFYPPNQPTARRCHKFGRALKRAIESWDGDARVALVCSGGLSHFVIDEEFDRKVIAAMQKNDAATIAAIPESLYQSGTSETKNWLPVTAAMADAGLEMRLVDYVPCYRSLAGTGNAMAFAVWQ
jgi:3-O-methylgallate 3,4-dioxygenase